jgi:hypothetical protein
MMAVRLFEKYVPPTQPGNQPSVNQQNKPNEPNKSTTGSAKPTSTPPSTASNKTSEKSSSAVTAKHSTKDLLEQPELLITKMEGMVMRKEWKITRLFVVLSLPLLPLSSLVVEFIFLSISLLEFISHHPGPYFKTRREPLHRHGYGMQVC